MKPHYLKFIIGKESPLGFSLFSGMVAFIGAVLLIENHWVGLVLVVTGLAIAFSFTGILLDPDRRRIKQYTWLLGWRAGKWHNLDQYRDVIVLRRNRRFVYNMRYLIGMGSRTEVSYEVLLGNHNHLDNLLVCRKNGEKAAYAAARKIAKTLSCEFVRYNPGRRWERETLIEFRHKMILNNGLRICLL